MSAGCTTFLSSFARLTEENMEKDGEWDEFKGVRWCAVVPSWSMSRSPAKLLDSYGFSYEVLPPVCHISCLIICSLNWAQYHILTCQRSTAVSKPSSILGHLVVLLAPWCGASPIALSYGGEKVRPRALVQSCRWALLVLIGASEEEK